MSLWWTRGLEEEVVRLRARVAELEAEAASSRDSRADLVKDLIVTRVERDTAQTEVKRLAGERDAAIDRAKAAEIACQGNFESLLKFEAEVQRLTVELAEARRTDLRCPKCSHEMEPLDAEFRCPGCARLTVERDAALAELQREKEHASRLEGYANAFRSERDAALTDVKALTGAAAAMREGVEAVMAWYEGAALTTQMVKAVSMAVAVDAGRSLSEEVRLLREVDSAVRAYRAVPLDHGDEAEARYHEMLAASDAVASHRNQGRKKGEK